MAGFLEGIDFSKMADIAPLAIMLDKAGQSFDPNSPFAGVGTFMGQSSLANKAMQEGKQERQDWRNLIAQAFGLNPEAGGGPKGSEMSGATQSSMSDVTKSLTSLEEIGPSKTTTKLDKDGRTVRVTEEIIGQPKKKDQYLDMSQITNLGF